MGCPFHRLGYFSIPPSASSSRPSDELAKATGRRVRGGITNLENAVIPTADPLDMLGAPDYGFSPREGSAAVG